MGCRATFSFTETVLGETPLDDAVYVPTVDKIFGTIGPHIARFNATTGAFETSVRVFGPAMGSCRICYHAPLDTIFVSIWNVLSLQWLTTDWAIRGIYPVNPSTLAIGSVIDINSFVTGDNEWPMGPRHIFSAGGTYLYFCHNEGDFGAPTEWWRVNPLNTADNFLPSNGDSLSGDNCYNQFDIDGLGNIYGANTESFELQRYDLALTNGSFGRCRINVPQRFVDNPVAVAWADSSGNCFAVCGTPTLIKATSFSPSPGAYTAHTMNSTSVSGMPALTTVRPVRMRYRDLDGMLYIPCQEHDAIIVWDPTSDDGEWKTGFSMPIDVVFTPTKAFAVQLGNEGLREIT